MFQPPLKPFFENIIFTHCTDSGVFKPTEIFLHEMFEGEIPKNIHLSNSAAKGLEILSTKEPKRNLVILAGKTHWKGETLMAGKLAQAIKEINDQTFVVAYSQSSLHREDYNIGALDAFIQRGGDAEYFVATQKYSNELWHELYYGEYRIAKFIYEVCQVEHAHQLPSLFTKEDRLVPQVQLAH